jgi:hypothetical protein
MLRKKCSPNINRTVHRLPELDHFELALSDLVHPKSVAFPQNVIA